MKAGSYRPPAVPRYKPVAPLRAATAKSMRKLAGDLKDRHPQMDAHQHIRDAAAALDRNEPDGAIRHLNAAIANMTPQSLRRHGLLTDDQHDAAKLSMDQVHRHLLLVKDVQDAQAHNAALPRAGDIEPGQENDSLNDRPTARQPFLKALNAPGRTNTGGPDPAVARPVAVTDPAKSKQVAASNSGDLTTAIDLSAKTPALATVPHPFGKPGGPGLWHQKGMQLPPYVQNIAHALLRTGRAKDESEAIAMARAATKRWKNGKNTSPEVRAASTASDVQWRADQARAHSHSNSHLARRIIELSYNPLQPRGRDGKWSRGAGLSAIDSALVKSTRANRAADARRSMRSPAGSAGHAAELRSLATEADSHAGRNFTTLEGSAEGAASREATRLAAGAMRSGPAESDAGRVLRRAATMLDRGQPSLARAHAPALRSAAVAERADPAYSGRLAAAADKLESLPQGRGLAAQPPATAAFQARTSATRRYTQMDNTSVARRIIELTGTAAGAAQDTRTPLGQFGTAGSSTTSKNTSSKSGAKVTKAASAKTAKTAAKPDAKKAGLLKQAAGFRAKADALIAQRDALRKELASASGKTSSGQSGSTTSGQSGSTTSSSASTTPSTSSTGSTATSATSAKSGSASSSSPSAAQLTSQIAAMNKQIVALQAQYRQAMAQAKAA